MPEVYKVYDNTRDIEAILAPELMNEDANSDKGMRRPDVLLIVPLKNTPEEPIKEAEEPKKRTDRRVLVFIEQQHEDDPTIGLRIFQVSHRVQVLNTIDSMTAFVIYTGNNKGVDCYETTSFGFKNRIEFKTFHLKDYNVDELRQDKSAIARVLYAALMANQIGDDPAKREACAEELLKMVGETEYNTKQRNLIIFFSRGIFRVNSSDISDQLKEKYNMLTESLEEALKKTFKELFEVECIEKCKAESQYEFARKMLADDLPIDFIAKYTDLDEKAILSLKENM
ncbi:MAG: hypothetical protein LBF38_02070 [Deltaproteobacteria bacterium]|nr:hypothetical protein [Deltaproteobacteria bacterium]